jgi:hypothetical protein
VHVHFLMLNHVLPLIILLLCVVRLFVPGQYINTLVPNRLFSFHHCLMILLRKISNWRGGKRKDLSFFYVSFVELLCNVYRIRNAFVQVHLVHVEFLVNVENVQVLFVFLHVVVDVHRLHVVVHHLMIAMMLLMMMIDLNSVVKLEFFSFFVELLMMNSFLSSLILLNIHSMVMVMMDDFVHVV